jgi:hypothetical protein
MNRRDLENLLRLFLIKNKIYEQFKHSLAKYPFRPEFKTIEGLCMNFIPSYNTSVINSFAWSFKRPDGINYWSHFDTKFFNICKKLRLRY